MRLNTTNIAASSTRLISVLTPFRITLSPLIVALVRYCATSVPACGSVMHTASIASPLHTLGRTRCLMCSGAYVEMIRVCTPTSPITAIAVT